MKGDNVMITDHALKRTCARTGYNPKTSERFIETALERGKSANEFASKERNYLLRKANGGCRLMVHNSYCFIVSKDDYCITMYSVPEWFGKIRYDGKREIRNVKKYIRFNDFLEKEDTANGLGKVS